MSMLKDSMFFLLLALFLITTVFVEQPLAKPVGLLKIQETQNNAVGIGHRTVDKTDASTASFAHNCCLL